MQKMLRIQMCSIVLFLVLAVCCIGLTSAETRHDFDDPGSPFIASQFGVSPPPTITPGGPMGHFMRLVTTTIVNVNTITFDMTDPGAFDHVTVDFDFRMVPGFGRADGFGFALLNTADFGSSGAVGGDSEEANYAGSLGVGFDIHQGPGELNNNHVSVHFNANKLHEFDAGSIDLASGQFIHAQIVMRPGLEFSDVTVILTPAEGQPVTVVDHLKVPGLNPYEGRVHFGARSGGESADHDLDNIVAQFTNPPPPPRLSIFPPPGILTTTFGFDIGLVVLDALDRTATVTHADLSSADLMVDLTPCFVTGKLIAGGQTFRCPNLSQFVGQLIAGTYTLSVTLSLDEGSNLNETIVWEVLDNTEPSMTLER